MAHHDIDVAELAAWLIQQGGEALWTVDGEENLTGQLSVPCTAEDLAGALSARGGRIRVYDPPGAARIAQGEPLSRANLDKTAEYDDDARAFRVAWLRENTAGEPWMLVEDTLAKTASSEQPGHRERPHGIA